MYQIDTAGNSSGHFQDGDPVNSVLPTLIDAHYMNSLQDEIISVISAANITLDKASVTQLLAAIRYLIALGGPWVHQGGGTNQGTNVVKIGWAPDASGLRATVDTTDLGHFIFNPQFDTAIAALNTAVTNLNTALTNAITTLTNADALRVLKAGDTMTGALSLPYALANAGPHRSLYRSDGTVAGVSGGDTCVTRSEFAIVNANSSFYWTLPGGMACQLFSSGVAGTNGYGQTRLFPIAFPTICLGCVASYGSNLPPAGGNLGIQQNDRAGYQITNYQPDGTTGTNGITVVAWGY